MRFNTQICTTREQSERLLALGLKKETADMCLDEVVEGEWMPIAVHVIFSSQIPAWSLHRLIAMCPDFVIAEQRNHEKLYEEVISNIKFAIEEGLFDVKYLEE